jgi:hypothetical protein
VAIEDIAGIDVSACIHCGGAYRMPRLRDIPRETPLNPRPEPMR